MEKVVTTITKAEAFHEINETQDYYVNELINLINDSNMSYLKAINFNSLTGTGKTKMMAKLINRLSDKYYFIITTLSKGQLNDQVTENLKKDCDEKNFKVYGTCDYKINSKLQAEDIINNIPKDKECLWLRDEGHIATNRFDQLLINKCFKVINFSATNTAVDINCNFTHTMMLRTVSQNCGTPEDAIKKLLLIKKEHKKVKNYNPCAIFRCVDSKNSLPVIIKLCEENNLKYINITEEDFDMRDLCKDDNEYDVIINKFKITEGIDIRRAHVLYMDNKPTNPATTIQVIGRCRRNALLYRDDIDILDKKNIKLLENTRKCYVYYNITDMHIDTDETGELAYAFCDTISIQALKPNSVITVENGILPNGLKIIELQGKSGNFKIKVDKETGFNVVDLRIDFYKKNIEHQHKPKFLICINFTNLSETRALYNIEDIEKYLTKKQDIKKIINRDTKKEEQVIRYYYDLDEQKEIKINNIVPKDLILYLKKSLLQLIHDINKYVPSKEVARRAKAFGCVHTVINIKQPILDIVKEQDNYCLNKTDIDRLIDDLIIVSKYTSTMSVQKYKKSKLYCNRNTKCLSIERIISIINTFIDTLDEKKDLTIVSSVYKNKIFPVKYLNKDEYLRNRYSHDQVVDNYLWCYGNKVYCNCSDNYKDYDKIMNDKESAIIGTDLMKCIKTIDNRETWVENSSVTSKLNKYCKFNTFIENKYKTQIAKTKNKLFSGKNTFNFDKRCNSCLGYCVEYYSKCLVFGLGYLDRYIEKAQKEYKYCTGLNFVTNAIIVRACMLKYMEMMKKTYGNACSRIIKTISVEKLIEDNYNLFMSTVIELGTKTATFVKKNLNITKEEYDPNLSIQHIKGLADYITEDTILDIKTTNNINKDMIKQVLAYHYLSTKRSDLNIKRVIVYDAVSDKSVEINLTV